MRGLDVAAPRQVVVSDTTYLRPAHGAFVYLFVVTDLYARRIVGRHVSRDLSREGAVIALQHAVATIGQRRGIVHYCDRGSQYCCHAHHMLSSMTDADYCYQNAVAERLNGILKDGFDLDSVFASTTAAQHGSRTPSPFTTRSHPLEPQPSDSTTGVSAGRLSNIPRVILCRQIWGLGRFTTLHLIIMELADVILCVVLARQTRLKDTLRKCNL